MLAQQHFVYGLVLAHLAWAWFYLCGTALRKPEPVEGISPAQALLDVVITSASGLALTGFATFVLGLAGLIYPLAAALAVPAVGVVCALRGDSPLRAGFWRLRFGQLKRALSLPAALVWLMAIPLALQAIVPDTGSDATVYYMTYGFEWAHAHRLVVDPWLRLPHTTNNWPLMLTWPYALGVDDYMRFLNWLTGAFTLLAVYAFTARFGRAYRDENAPDVPAAGVLAALAVALTPMFVEFVDYNMIDVPTSLFFTVSAMAGIRAVQRCTRGVLAEAVVLAAFLIGLKVSLLLLGPLFAALILIALRGAPRRRAVLALAALVVLASPWYVRSFVYTGDPIDPILNLRFHHADPKWSVADEVNQLGDLRTDTSPGTLLQIPRRLFLDPSGRDLRDTGVSLADTLYVVPLAFLAFVLLARRLRPSPVALAACALAYAYAYWTLTSHLARYVLLFVPLLAAFLALFALALTAHRRIAWRAAALAALALLAIPSPSPEGRALFWNIYVDEYLLIGQLYAGRTVWLEDRAPAYSSIEYLCRTLPRAHRPHDNVYVVLLGGSQIFFKECGIQIIGDSFGPERYGDLSRAVAHDDVTQWAERFHVGSFMLPDYEDKIAIFAGLRDTLTELGWREVLFPQSDYIVYLSPETQRALEAHPQNPQK